MVPKPKPSIKSTSAFLNIAVVLHFLSGNSVRFYSNCLHRRPVSWQYTMMRTLRELLETLVQKGGADLFLVVGEPPSIRVTGAVERLDQASLDADEIENTVL